MKRLLLGSLLLCACQRPAPEVSAPVPEAAPARGPSARLEAERRLALAPVPGQGRTDQDIAQAQEAARRNPDKMELWVLIGRAFVRKAREASEPGYYTNADAAARVALDLLPESPVALDLRGLVLLNEHRFQEALDLAQRTVALRPDDPLAYGTLSDAHLELGRFKEAVAAAQKMMNLKPNLPAYTRASYLRWLTGDLEGAKEMIRQAIDASGARDPEPRAFALTQAAQYFLQEGDLPGSEAGFDMALQGFADYPAALSGKGRVALARGDGKQAAQLFERAYQQSPLPETAWLLGDARRLAGEEAGAKEAYERVLKQGRRADPRTVALFLATRNQDAAEALRLAEEERKGRGDVYTRDVYALALMRAGKAAAAKQEIDGALELGTKDARLWCHASLIYAAAGQAAAGRAFLQRALRHNPHADAACTAEARRILGDKP